MKGCQEGWTRVEVGVVSLGRFLCSVEAGGSSVARRVSVEVRSVVLCKIWGLSWEVWQL